MNSDARRHIDELYRIGMNIREAESHKKGYSDGIKKILTGLYPDNAHFVFELFQNAEDAQATYLEFDLTPDALIFKHNGTRLFNKDDVDSITNIGDSSKLEDFTKIGKFGIGFKAVFAYTTSPRIFSGDYWFEIRDLICPVPLDCSPAKAGETLFEFPFNNPQRPAERCFSEIARCLWNLQDNVLLFLNNITRISWRISGQGEGWLSCEPREGNQIRICKQHKGDVLSESFWLRFWKQLGDADQVEGTKNSVSIAYCLEPADKVREKTEMKIVPLPKGQVSIYFPAEKETSNLRFHIHAPFASTVARDSVRDCSENLSLRNSITELVVESLALIRDASYLTVGFLATLPLPGDNLPSFYEPIREKVIKAFWEANLMPLKAGGHAPAKSMYTGVARISDLISDTDLGLITRRSPPLWAANPSRNNQRELEFLKSLKIEPWSWEQLGTFLCSREGKEFLAGYVEAKDDVWLRDFYSVLWHGIEAERNTLWSESVPTALKRMPITRVLISGKVDHVVPPKAYFPFEGLRHSSHAVPFVKAEVYTTGKDNAKGSARFLLELIGVGIFDEQAEIMRTLSSYQPNSIDVNLHLKHIRQVVAYWKCNPNSASDFTILKFLAVKMGVSGNVVYQFFTPRQLCLDAPYEETGLSKLVSVHNKSQLWEGYAQCLERDILGDFLRLLKASGVMHCLTISEVKGYHNPHRSELKQDYLKNPTRETGKGIDEDYTIQDLDKYLRLGSFEASLLIWNTMISAGRKVAKARYSPNAKYTPREADSTLVCLLKAASWIPDRAGVFYKPQDITRDELHELFTHDDRNGLITAIGFGENAVKKTFEYTKKKLALREMVGLTPEEAGELKAILSSIPGSRKSEIFSQMLSRIREELSPETEERPTSQAPDPERREAKVQENAQSAADREYERRNRSVRVSSSPEKKSYLRAHNSTDNGHVYCQLCHERMPFAVKGEDHFEAIEFVKLQKEYPENSLAMCPNCAAEYKIACLTPESERIERLIAVDHALPEDELLISLDLPVHSRLRFTQRHVIDLKAILKLAKGNPASPSAEAPASKAALHSEVASGIAGAASQKVGSSPGVSTISRVGTTVSLIDISDRRVRIAVSSMPKLYSRNKAEVLAKGGEVVKRILKNSDCDGGLLREGITISSLRQAFEFLIPGLVVENLGFSNFVQFLHHICNQSGVAAVYFKPPSDFRINVRNIKMREFRLFTPTRNQ